MDLSHYQDLIYKTNLKLGWRGNPRHPDPGFDEAMTLLVTEISEAADAWRRHGFEDVTCRGHVHAHGYGGALCKPEGVGSEFADILIRLLDDMHLFRLKFITPGRPWEPPGGRSLLASMFDLTAITVKAEASWARNGAPGASRWLSEFYRHLRGYAVAYGIDLRAETDRKLAYNATRAYRHGGKRM